MLVANVLRRENIGQTISLNSASSRSACVLFVNVVPLGASGTGWVDFAGAFGTRRGVLVRRAYRAQQGKGPRACT
jgi:hypothetical protein